jgi:hypothetical protein
MTRHNTTAQEMITGLSPDESAEFRRQQQLHDEPREHAYKNAMSANFRPRNLALADLTRMVGQANRLRGATFQHNIDPTTEIKGAGSAAERELIIRATAFDIGERACGLCSLQEYCDLTPDGLLDLVAERDYDGHIIPAVTARRARLASRVEADVYKSNNHLCATNAAPDHLRNDTM